MSWVDAVESSQVLDDLCGGALISAAALLQQHTQVTGSALL